MRSATPQAATVASVVVPLLVGLAFCAAIASVWLSKPVNNRGIFHDTGYDEKNPPSPKEWRSVQARYTILLAFLGTLFVVVAHLSLSG